jgi:hypothetical protein
MYIQAMKKTVYFNSQEQTPNLSPQQISAAIDAVTSLRDNFLLSNSAMIAKIDNEQIQFVTWNNFACIIAVITLTYYEK